jgi:cytochrome b involved in lipid metabolism
MTNIIKNIALISLGALVATLVWLQLPSKKAAPAAQGSVQSASTSSVPATYTASQVAAHSSSGDCWLIISQNVYNVTEYLPRHPAGENMILAYCGRDATTAFQSQGGRGRDHSGYAYTLLDSYLVGTLSSN